MTAAQTSILVLGFVGQALFSLRMLLQWLASERAGQSIVPAAFWWISLAGGGVLFAYAVLRSDPVFIAGQGVGLVIYLRNIYLVRRSDAHAGSGVS